MTLHLTKSQVEDVVLIQEHWINKNSTLYVPDIDDKVRICIIVRNEKKKILNSFSCGDMAAFSREDKDSCGYDSRRNIDLVFRYDAKGHS